MIKLLVSFDKKNSYFKKKDKISIKDCIKELIRLENTVLDFYDYKKTIAKMKKEKIKYK